MTPALLRFTQFLLATLLVTAPEGCRIPDRADDDSQQTTKSLQLQRFTFSRGLMGVECRIVLYASDSDTATPVALGAFRRVAELDAILSDYRPDSELNRLCDQAGGEPVQVSPDLFDILRLSKELSEKTGGAFDVTHGRLYHLWREARGAGRWPTQGEVETARSQGGWKSVAPDEATRQVRLTIAGTQLDVGGIGKGYAAQAALDVLATHGCPIALVDLGGDLVLGDPPPGREGWNVQVDDGFGAPRTIPLSRCAVATSGASEQFMIHDGGRYSHIIDPSTGWPLADAPAVTIIAPDGALADALASAISVLGPSRGRAVAATYEGVTVIIHGDT